LNTILYLHGFISSPASKKAVMLGDYVLGQAPGVECVVPALHHRPARAMAQVRALCRGGNAADLVIVGSSLGGFYATIAAEETGCRAVVINPAVHPQRHFGRYLGPQRNVHTGEAFDLTDEHVTELAALDPPAVTRPERFWLMVETGDEILDYREATAYYAGSFQTVVKGGDHSFTSFPEFVPDIVAWARRNGEAVRARGSP
jgi:predicted esterase YcpF (UPF0227 family)